VKQVLLYWEGQMLTNVAGDNTARLNGSAVVTGALIGGPAFFFRNAYSSAFRADITNLNLIQPGYNTLTVDDVSFTGITNGAGLLVIIEDASGPAVIEVRDGVDLAYFDFPEPRQSTVAQTYVFPPAPVERAATLTIFASSVAGTMDNARARRPESLEITVNGQTTTFPNELNSWDGDEWDTKTNSVIVPAGATTLTAQLFSRDDLNTGLQPSSLAWIASTLVLNAPDPDLIIEKQTNGADADDANDVDVPVLAPGSPVTWTYRITNTGSLPFTESEIVVTDDLVGPVTQIIERLGNADEVLAPGESWIYQATGTALDLATNPVGVTIVEGCSNGQTTPTLPTYRNIGTVVGTPTVGGDPILVSDPSHYCNNVLPAITIEKATNGEDADTPTGPLIPVGSPVTWTYVVTNTGSVTLTAVTVTDDQGVNVSCPQTVVAPGATMTCTATGIALAGQYANIGSVIGTPVTDAPPVTDDDPSHYFGYIPAAVGDKVFRDINPAGTTPEEIAGGNGLQDAGELGIDGVIVELYSSDNTLISTTVTANGGLYLFPNLPPGDYYLRFINGLGEGIWTTPNVGDNDAIDSDAAEPLSDPRGDARQTATFTLTPGETDLTWDAGLIGVGGAASATVGDRVWLDLNRNGLQDPGETGVTSVPVRLFTAEGTLVRETTTNDQGLYLFTGLNPGQYYVEFVLPDNFAVTEPNVGDNEEIDSDADPVTGRTAVFDLADFVTDLTWDMGLFQITTDLETEEEPQLQLLYLPFIRGNN
jgi:hypothetical protein